MSDPPAAPRLASPVPLLTALWPWLLAGAGMAAVALVHQDYGATWDEGAQAKYGELALAYFASGLEDTACNDFLDLRLYGPLYEMIPAAVYGPGNRFEVRHLFFGLLGVWILPAVALYGRLFRVPRLAPLAVVALCMLPRFVGHLCNNSKDVPFALATAWFLLAATWLALRGASWRRVLACGGALGLTAWARPGGVPLMVVYLIGVVALASLLRLPGSPAERRRLWLAIPLAAAVGWLLMILPWPWAHADPIRHPLAAMLSSADFAASYPVLFEGEVVASDRLPWSYLGKYLLITTPPTLLLLAALGAGLAAIWLLRRRSRERALLGGVTLMWLGVPLLAFVVQRPNVYDGLRHFLFVLPAVAVLAGLGAAAILERAQRARWRAVAWPAVLAALLLPAQDLIALHPYQTTHFNGLVGGLGGAYGRYETDYWVSSYREAMLWINRQAAGEPRRIVRVLVAGGEGVYVRPAAEHYAAANVEVVTPREIEVRRLEPAAIDFYLATTRYGLDRALPGPIVHSVGRRGAVFAVIKRLAGPARE